MKTIFIATSKPGNARPDYFRALGKSFALHGYKVILILDGNAKELPQDKEIIYKSWPNRRPTGLKDFVFLFRLLYKYKPSILISSFGAVNIMNCCGYLYGVKNRINYLLSVSELFSDDDAKSIKNRFLKFRKKQVYQLATLLIPNSNGTKNDMITYYKLANKNVIVLPNLISSLNVAFNEKKNRKNHVLIVGNLIPLKGQRHVIDQFKEVLRIFPQLTLKILGSGPEKAKLTRQVHQLHLENNIEFIGKVSYAEISSFFAAALVHISASKNEAFGFVNIEALRAGTPIICTKTAGSLAIISEGQNGEFFSVEDNASLAKSLSKILSDWNGYSVRALKSYNDNYDLFKNINHHRDQLLQNIKQ